MLDKIAIEYSLFVNKLILSLQAICSKNKREEFKAYCDGVKNAKKYINDRGNQ